MAKRSIKKGFIGTIESTEEVTKTFLIAELVEPTKDGYNLVVLNTTGEFRGYLKLKDDNTIDEYQSLGTGLFSQPVIAPNDVLIQLL